MRLRLRFLWIAVWQALQRAVRLPGSQLAGLQSWWWTSSSSGLFSGLSQTSYLSGVSPWAPQASQCQSAAARTASAISIQFGGYGARGV